MAGPDEAGLLPELITKVQAAGLENRFHYVGVLVGDDKLALLRRSDCFVLPTLAEGMSMVLLEAMAAGCAVLTTPGANFREIAHAGAGEILPRSTEAFADAMTRLSEGGRSQAAFMGGGMHWSGNIHGPRLRVGMSKSLRRLGRAKVCTPGSLVTEAKR